MLFRPVLPQHAQCLCFCMLYSSISLVALEVKNLPTAGDRRGSCLILWVRKIPGRSESLQPNLGILAQDPRNRGAWGC